MGKIDKIKEHIGALKVYLAIVVSLMVTIGAGVANLYISSGSTLMIWLGVVGIVVLSIAFAVLAKYMHNKINELEEL